MMQECCEGKRLDAFRRTIHIRTVISAMMPRSKEQLHAYPTGGISDDTYRFSGASIFSVSWMKNVRSVSFPAASEGPREFSTYREPFSLLDCSPSSLPAATRSSSFFNSIRSFETWRFRALKKPCGCSTELFGPVDGRGLDLCEQR